MKKASSSFLVLFFAALLVSFNSFAQFSMGQNETIRESVNQNLRSYERLRLSDLLRLSYQEQSSIEIVSLSISAQSLTNTQTQLQLTQHGRLLTSETVRRQMREIRLMLPARTMADGLELSAQGEIYLESITAEVSFSRMPGPGQGYPGPGYEQPAQPNSLITLHVNQSVRSYARIPLEQLARQQMGISLQGAEIERVVVQGQSSYGRAASVQVELNGRQVGQSKYLSAGQTPLPIETNETVRSLALIVNGDAQISEIRIRVGQVRNPGPQLPQTQRVYVGREVSSYSHLELSSLLGYESRLIRSITIEASASRYGQAQLEVATRYGEIQGVLFVSGNTIRATIQLRRPMAAHELRLQSMSPVHVSSLEIQFEQQYPYY